MTLRALLLLAAVPSFAGAQQPARRGGDSKPCVIVFTGTSISRSGDSTRFTSYTTGTGTRNTFVGGGVDATCAGQGNRLLADSAEHYEDRGLLILYHNVRYSEPRLRLTSDRMFYYTADERLLAEGNVKGRSSTGTRFEGPQLEYFRQKPGLRAVPRWSASGRPFVRMSPAEGRAAAATPRDTGSAPSDSVDLTADRVVSENDSLVWAGGRVVIERPDMRATADSATMDNGIEFARLLRDPTIVGRGERPFTLDGVVIDLWSRKRQLERVVAEGEAKVVSDSLTLTADTIDMRLKEQRMERVYTWGGRSRAETPSQWIEADSLDIRMPGQRLREVHAVGSAKATSVADTIRLLTDEPDWISGDTIVAHFDTVASADTTAQARMREVVATGRARSFYQLAPSSTEKGGKELPNISYNRGRVITVSFAEGEVTAVEVKDRATGVFLEPVPVPAARDTTKGPVPVTPARRP